RQTTPQGVSIISTVPVPDQALRIVDNAIADQIRRSRTHYPHWQFWGKHSAYQVIFIDPMATNKITDPGSPAILVRGIQSAGTVIGWWGRAASPRISIVVAHHAATNWQGHTNFQFNAVGNEGEHCNA